MKARITFETTVEIKVYDGFTDDVRKLQAELGDSYLTAQSSDRDIFERIAIIRGLRGLSHDEALDTELNRVIDIRVSTDEEPLETELIDWPAKPPVPIT